MYNYNNEGFMWNEHLRIRSTQGHSGGGTVYPYRGLMCHVQLYCGLP